MKMFRNFKVVLLLAVLMAILPCSPSLNPLFSQSTLPPVYNTGNVFFLYVPVSPTTPLLPKDTIFAFCEISGKNVILGYNRWNADSGAIFSAFMNETGPQAPEIYTGASYGQQVFLGLLRSGNLSELNLETIYRAADDNKKLLPELKAYPMDLSVLSFSSIGDNITLYPCPFYEWELVQLPMPGISTIALSKTPVVGELIDYYKFNPRYLKNGTFTLSPGSDSKLQNLAFGRTGTIYKRLVVVGLQDIKKGYINITVSGNNYLGEPWSSNHTITFPPGKTELIPNLTTSQWQRLVASIKYQSAPGGVRVYSPLLFPEVTITLSGSQVWKVSTPGFPNPPVLFTINCIDGKLDFVMALPLNYPSWAKLDLWLRCLYSKNVTVIDARKIKY
jgi:hypothetical protein